jgi:methylated-DNA-[protein]-cysteine S-methyltransferase
MTTGEQSTAVVRIRVSTPVGDFAIEASARGLRAVTPVGSLEHGEPRTPQGSGGGSALDHAQAAADALARYARGERADYRGPLDLAGSAFHLAVWERLRAIPFGGTTRYGAIASALGMPGEARGGRRRGRQPDLRAGALPPGARDGRLAQGLRLGA